ncbi:hypothetical protein [Synechococcus sp. A15-28]|uniref:hypothetical protein n=1 Tax=Synechococcus sp. A15-28 TaxID=1050638 RepID=UPI00164545BD|nr:hypothetical protein [Synechococcus sp. A15-28]QNI41208.1 hypothetical protein SynA1528_00160 [Synechococcus sp. A15-28]
MKKKIIAIDWDGTLTDGDHINFPLLQYLNSYFSATFIITNNSSVPHSYLQSQVGNLGIIISPQLIANRLCHFKRGSDLSFYGRFEVANEIFLPLSFDEIISNSLSEIDLCIKEELKDYLNNH